MLSVFLSHSSSDKPIVTAVAKALGRLGVVPWLDTNDLFAGRSLVTALREAIHQQMLVVFFLSRASLDSAWANDELRHALDLEKERPEWIVPVYLEEELPLIRSSGLLRNTWLHPNGDRVIRLGVRASQDAVSDVAREGARIAREIAKRAYALGRLGQAHDINVVLDQRGAGGQRAGRFELPPNLVELKSPTLIFRPDQGARTSAHTLTGPAFVDFAQDVTWALGAALGTLRSEKTIRVCGDAQLAMYYLLGRHLDRTTGARLYIHNSQSNLFFDNAAQSRITPLSGGNAHCEITGEMRPGAPPKMEAGVEAEVVALYVGSQLYLPDALAHAAANGGGAGVFVESGRFESSAQMMGLVADVVALLTRLRHEHKMKILRLYSGLPGAAVALLAANLTLVMEHVDFMEFRRDFATGTCPVEDRYAALRAW